MSAQALASSFDLHSMKSTMSGWSMLRMTILAARRVLPPDLMTPAKASKPFMKLSGPLAVPPPERFSLLPRMGGEVGAGAGSPLEEHALGLGEGEDGVHRVLNGVDEAGGALGMGVSGAPKTTACVCWSKCQVPASDLGSRRSQPTLNQTGELKAMIW